MQRSSAQSYLDDYHPQWVSSPLFCHKLSYKFVVDGIEYGKGEGGTKGAASDVAATQALSKLYMQGLDFNMYV